MSIRQGYFRIGETVEVSGTFFDSKGLPIDAGGVSLIVKRPDSSIQEIPLTPIEGVIAVDLPADMVGTWWMRLEWQTPKPSNTEAKFDVVASKVLPPSE